MKLRGRSPSCGIYYLEPLRAKRGAEEPVGRILMKLNPSLYLYFPFNYITIYIKSQQKYRKECSSGISFYNK